MQVSKGNVSDEDSNELRDARVEWWKGGATNASGFPDWAGQVIPETSHPFRVGQRLELQIDGRESFTYIRVDSVKLNTRGEPRMFHFQGDGPLPQQQDVNR